MIERGPQTVELLQRFEIHRSTAHAHANGFEPKSVAFGEGFAAVRAGSD